MKDLPPMNETPQDAGDVLGAVLPIEEYSVHSWSPEAAEANGPVTQVHLVVRVRSLEWPLVMRFKSADAIDTFIAALSRHREDVFGRRYPMR